MRTEEFIKNTKKKIDEYSKVKVKDPWLKDKIESVGVIPLLSLASACLGATMVFSYNFTTMLPLITGGAFAVVPIVTVLAACYFLGSFKEDDINKSNKEDDAISKSNIKEPVYFALKSTVPAALVGVGLGAAAGALFPGFMLTTWSAVLAGAVIAGMATASSLVVGKYVTDPTITKVEEWLSSRQLANA